MTGKYTFLLIYRQFTLYWGQNRNISILTEDKVNITSLPIFGITPGGKLRFIPLTPGTIIVILRYCIDNFYLKKVHLFSKNNSGQTVFIFYFYLSFY